MQNVRSGFSILSLLALVVLAGGNALGASATDNATATVITPIAIASGTDLAFGKFSVSSVAGTVVVSTSGSRSATGGVLLSTSTVTAGTFSVTGQASTTYAITLPASASTLSDGNSHSMTVDTWTSNPSGTGTLSSGGAQTVNIGGTLHVAGSQVGGAYTGTFSVSVDYN